MILIIYIGAIAVLFLFMVMLFDRTEYKKIIKFEQSSNLIIFLLALFAFVIGGFLFVNILVIDLFNFDFSTLEFTKKKLGFDAVPVLKKYAFRVFPENGLLISEAGLGKFFSHSKIAQMDCPDVYLIGKFLYTKYFILLIIAGFGLLVAMMGCILITKSSFMDKFNRKNQKIEKQLSRFKI
jgi:NADH:ubiquinone oxidoreductase subunit 6 (subunit J)